MICHSESEVRDPQEESTIEADSAAGRAEPDLHARIQFVTRAMQERPEIYRLMCRMSRNRADARELTQDVYLKLWRLTADETRQVRQMGAFVHTVALRVAQDWKAHGRRQKRQGVHIPLLEEILPSNPDANPETEADFMQTKERLERAVLSLPPRQRLIFTRCAVEACAVGAVARELGCSAVTIRRELAKALATLREVITDTDGGAFVRT